MIFMSFQRWSLTLTSEGVFRNRKFISKIYSNSKLHFLSFARSKLCLKNLFEVGIQIQKYFEVEDSFFKIFRSRNFIFKKKIRSRNKIFRTIFRLNILLRYFPSTPSNFLRFLSSSMMSTQGTVTADDHYQSDQLKRFIVSPSLFIDAIDHDNYRGNNSPNFLACFCLTKSEAAAHCLDLNLHLKKIPVPHSIEEN